MATEMKIHKVIEGPYEDEMEMEIWLLCLAEENGELTEVEMYFDTFDEAYQFKNHFAKSIDPIIFNYETDNEDMN